MLETKWLEIGDDNGDLGAGDWRLSEWGVKTTLETQQLQGGDESGDFAAGA